MPAEIIAEVAQGYQGDAALAQELVLGAVTAGADAVKLQLVYADELATPDYKYYNLFRSLEMPQEVWQRLRDEAKAGGLRIYLDVYGQRSLREAIELNVDGVKIHATDFFNTKLVSSVLDAMTRVYISLGGISVPELENFLHLHKVKNDQVFLMYGFQVEPTRLEDNNLRRINALRNRFPGYRFGFMDHSDGGSNDAMTLALLALALDIDCIEKHITLDRSAQLEDYVSALSPASFRVFVQRIRHLENALGTDNLGLTAVEQEYRSSIQKVVVAERELIKGEVLTPETISLKRVANTSPSSLYRIEQVTGRRLTVNVMSNQQVTEEMFS